MRKLICPKCNKEVELPDSRFGVSDPPCPHCGEEILWFLQEDGEFIEFRVQGGTGAYKQGKKKWGGHKT